MLPEYTSAIVPIYQRTIYFMNVNGKVEFEDKQDVRKIECVGCKDYWTNKHKVHTSCDTFF